MPNSLSWIDNADIKKIRGIVARSADVIAAARQDIEEHRCLVDGQRSTDLRKLELSSQPADHQQVASAHRRALFRRSLRTPDSDVVSTPYQESVRNVRIEETSAKQIEKGAGATSPSEIAKRQSIQHERQPVRAHLRDENYEELRKRDGQINWRRKFRDKETATSRSLPNYVSSMPVSWTQRLDYLINVVIGVLATALVISLFVRSSVPDPYADVSLLVANEKTTGEQRAILPEPQAALRLAHGFDILPKAFPEPLPTIVVDILSLLFLAAPLRASAPGVVVLPYTGLPQAVPAFPEDIARLIVIALPESKKSELY